MSVKAGPKKSNLRRTFGLQADKVPEVVVRALARGHLIVRFRLNSMDDIGELDCVLDEEYGDCNGADEQLEKHLAR